MSTTEKPCFRYKYCIVPCCTNTTKTAPDKIFLAVPRCRRKREEWSKAMKRHPLSELSSHYCCEDHFSLEEDLENYWQWKLMGNVQKKLKDGVVPHIFDCQTKTSVLRSKRKPLVAVPAELSPVEPVSPVHKSFTFSGSEQSSSHFAVEDDMKDKCIQVNFKKHFQSTGTNTDIPNSSVSCSPIQIYAVPQSGYSHKLCHNQILYD